MPTFDLDRAIVQHWGLSGLDTYIFGGLHESQAPREADKPYVVYETLGEVTRGRTTGASGHGRGRLVSAQMQMRLHCDGGKEMAQFLAEKVRAAFDDADLVTADAVLYCRYESGVGTRDLNEPNTRLFAMTFTLLIKEDR